MAQSRDPQGVGQLAADEAPVSAGYARYAVVVLLGLYTVNYIDRQIINILVEPIRAELKLADWQIGLMSGMAFALFYTVLGIPIARLAERHNRPLIIATAATVWSSFTLLCGAAQNFTHLALARMGVGVGEAGLAGPAHSLISSYVPRSRRARALAVYAMGTSIGAVVGLSVGGVVADQFGWRMAFLAAGLPGLGLALIAATTLVEPRRRLSADLRAQQATSTFGETLKLLAGKPTFWLISGAAAFKTLVGYGSGPFIASYFLRNRMEGLESLSVDLHGLIGVKLGPIGIIGLGMGLVMYLPGILGTWWGGWITDRLGPERPRAHMVAPALIALVQIPLFVTALSMSNVAVALVILGGYGFCNAMWQAPVFTTAQSIVPPHMRATTAAILMFLINVLSLGLGPLMVGLLSDVFSVKFGMGPAEGLRWALICLAFTATGAFALFWAARRTIARDTVG